MDPCPNVSRSWIESELRALREAAVLERDRINERFASVNQLREQVLQERGMFVRHEVVEALRERVSKLEGQAINHDDHERLTNRVARLESIGPIVALVAAAIGTAIGYGIEHIFR